MRKKKICFVVSAPITVSAFLCDHITLLTTEYDVHVVANFQNDEQRKNIEVLGVTCHFVPILRSIDINGDLKAMRQLKALFRREKFDCVHSVTPKAGLLTALAAKSVGIKHRIHIYTGQVWATRTGAMRWLLKMMDKMIASRNTNLLVDGQGQRQFLIKEGVLRKENSAVLANGSISGVNLSRFSPNDEVRKRMREELGIGDEKVVFIFLGRLNHDKGIGELLTAFGKLYAECPNAYLLLVGFDEEHYAERAAEFSNILIGENCTFYPPTPKPEDLYQAGDVFCLPTWREGFGSSVLEAQALELPVITSDAYGVVDASVPGVTGLRCGVNDPNGLFLCMKKYYDNPALRREHGLAGRKRVEKDFDSRIVSAAWLDYYKTLLS